VHSVSAFDNVDLVMASGLFKISHRQSPKVLIRNTLGDSIYPEVNFGKIYQLNKNRKWLH